MSDSWGLEDEPCDWCGVKPTRHEGHGSYSCKTCWDKKWCPTCTYMLGPNHVCVTPEEHEENEKNEKKMALFWAELGIDPDEK